MSQGMIMKKMAYFTAVILFAFYSVVVQSAEDTKTYTFGVVPQFEPRKIHAIWRPILDVLEQRTGFKFKLLGSNSIANFEREFSQGSYDFTYMNPYHLLIANEKAGYLPLVRDISRQLYGVLVVRKDSPIESPKQLDGRSVAFPSPNALGASLLVRKDLTDDYGIKFTSHYVKTHDSVYLNVLLREMDAGGGVQKTLARQKQKIQQNLRVIHTTRKVAPHPIAALPSVPAADRLVVQQALLEMGSSDSGKKLLAKIPMKSAGEANMDDYLPMKEMELERFYVAPN